LAATVKVVGSQKAWGEILYTGSYGADNDIAF
jgi:hypothetical protein